MAFVAYFDESGGQNAVGKVIAGYIARVEEWERFDTDWRLVLASANVPYFHMKEFAHFKGPYAGWRGQETRRINFLNRLISVTKDNLRRRITTIVLNDDYSEVDREYLLTEAVGGPYALAARTCAGKIRTWMSKEGYSEPLKFVFEAGDAQVDIGQLQERFRQDGLSIPGFEDKCGADGRWLTPFQAADFAAYEALKVTDWADKGLIRSMHDFRKPLLKLTQIPASDGTYVKADLVRMCQRAEIPKREVIRDMLSQ